MITIRLVVVDGRLVGRTFSDAWNLGTLMGESGYTESLPYHKNGSSLRKLRAANAGTFKFVVDAKATVEMPTDAEIEAMHPVRAKYAA